MGDHLRLIGLVEAPNLAWDQLGDNSQLISLAEAPNLARQSDQGKIFAADISLVIDPNQFDQGKPFFFPQLTQALLKTQMSLIKGRLLFFTSWFKPC